MKLVTTVYGNDDPATSLTVLQGLLSAYPNLRGIISPTTVGISTAAQYLDTHKSLLTHLTLTGLGLPSQMKNLRPRWHGQAVRAVEPEQPGLSRRRRGSGTRLGHHEPHHRLHIHPRQAR